MKQRKTLPPVPTVRCAIYTRKSTEDGLQQDFNTLDAQRESAEAYITAHKNEGWVCLPDRYDDGGFTGGNLDRPAFKRLMADVEAGKINSIVVYKIDRLSRSLADFARVMEILERHDVALVAITQSLDTKTSMGRLTLNVLLSFAQFEREIISERTRDKIAAARRKGKWSGGKPLLGYDMNALPGGTKLVINEVEAAQVRSIFETYLKHEALIATVTDITDRGFTSKRWTTKAGNVRGGRRFDKTTLYQLLTNITYLGKVKYKDEVHPGEHAAIVDAGVFEKVQATLRRNGRSGGSLVRNKYGALLRGVLECGSCRCSMVHTYTTKPNGRHYRYYVCLTAQKRGWHVCSTKSVPAHELEQFVVDQIRAIGRDPALVKACATKAREATKARIDTLKAELDALTRAARKCGNEVRDLAGDVTRAAAMADAQDRLRATERRQKDVTNELEDLKRDLVDDDTVAEALAQFGPVWETLSPREQARLISLMVSRVTYNADAGTVVLTFRTGASEALAAKPEEIAA